MKLSTSSISGRGIFATHDYKKGQNIESCPVIRLTLEDRKTIDTTALFDYYYAWGEDSSEAAIALGYGSLYNHSYTPNATYSKDFSNDLLLIQACRDISAGEEITVNYNGSPQDMSPVWFMAQDN